MASRRRVLIALLLVATATVACLAGPVARGWRAASLLRTLATPLPDPPEPAFANGTGVRIDLDLEHAWGKSRARLYHIPGRRGPGLVVAHGVHHRGIEERRLVRFASALAEAGFVVLTPQLEDLCHYRVTPRGLGEIRAAVQTLSSRQDLVEGTRVGLMGFSFAGGLALVAASEGDVQRRLRYVVSVGGHHDLTRVLRFFATDRIATPTGQQPLEAHPYGIVVLLHDHVEQFVGAEDTTTLRDALGAWLREDRERARAVAASCSTARCREVFRCAETDDAALVGPQVLAMVDAERPTLDALSPAGRLRGLEVPVLLLHGTQDRVIPPSELAWAAQELEGRDFRALASPLLDHVEVGQAASWQDYVSLVDFMAELF